MFKKKNLFALVVCIFCIFTTFSVFADEVPGYVEYVDRIGAETEMAEAEAEANRVAELGEEELAAEAEEAAHGNGEYSTYDDIFGDVEEQND